MTAAPAPAVDADAIMAKAKACLEGTGWMCKPEGGPEELSTAWAALRAAVEQLHRNYRVEKMLAEGWRIRAERAEQDTARLREAWPKVRALLTQLKAARDSGKVPYSHATDIQIGPLVAAIDAAMKEGT